MNFSRNIFDRDRSQQKYAKECLSKVNNTRVENPNTLSTTIPGMKILGTCSNNVFHRQNENATSRLNKK